MATFFWGFRQDTLRTAVYRAYRVFDCEGEANDYCYPLAFYKPEFEDDWSHYGLQPPAYYGVPGDTFTDLGHYVADDPRFAECTARRFRAYLHQEELHDAPVRTIAPLQSDFIASGYDAKALAKQIVLSDAFAVAGVEGGAEAAGPSLRSIRPEQLARTIEDLTGFAHRVNPGCSFDGCFHDVNLTTSDRFGFRAMAGGVDGLQVTRPTHTPTPTKVLYHRYLAAEAAAWVVEADFAEPDPDARKLLWRVEADTLGGKSVRDQIAWLHGRILGEFVEPDGPTVDATYALFQATTQGGATPAHAWEVVITALLQDPRMMFY
jgi:hypothetical protein